MLNLRPFMQRTRTYGNLYQHPAEHCACACRDLTERELDAVLDLRPFMQRSPFVVHGGASLARTYRLFRTLGLHHLFVGSARPRVIGLVTRKVRTRARYLYCTRPHTPPGEPTASSAPWACTTCSSAPRELASSAWSLGSCAARPSASGAAA